MAVVRSRVGSENPHSMRGFPHAGAQSHLLWRHQPAIEEFERKVPAYEQQSSKTVDDAITCGITIKGMEDEQIQKHLAKNSDRLETWPKMRDEIRDMLRTESYLNSSPAPMQIWSYAQGQGQRQGQGWEWAETFECPSFPEIVFYDFFLISL